MMTQLRKNIENLNNQSESIRKICDRIRVTSQREIAKLHAGKTMDFSSMRTDIKKLEKLIKVPLVYALNKGSIFMAYQEYAEAEIVWAFVNNKDLPQLNIPEPAYFTGLCDAIGEVKRQFMIALIDGNGEKARMLLKKSLKTGSLIAEIDASPAVINTLKPKKDMVRRSIESMLELSVRNK
jgi:translin